MKIRKQKMKTKNNKNAYENKKQKNKKDEETKNKRGENVAVKLEPMIKMEVEKDPTLGTVEKEKMNKLLEHVENSKLQIENNKENEKGDILEQQQQEKRHKNSIQKSQKVMGKEISMRICMLMILLNCLACSMLRRRICFWKSTYWMENRIWIQR